MGLWGTIGFKLVQRFAPNSVETNQPKIDSSFKPESLSQLKQFSVSSVDRDPFLGTLKQKKKRTPSKKNVPKPVFDYNLNVIYSGIIKKQHSNNQIFILTINGKQHLLKRGQTADSLKLIKGDNNKIVVRYNGVPKIIKRQHDWAEN